MQRLGETKLINKGLNVNPSILDKWVFKRFTQDSLFFRKSNKGASFDTKSIKIDFFAFIRQRNESMGRGGGGN